MTDTTPRLPISRVTLYTSGVGYFERTGEVESDATLTLSFPLGQVNDVLKSLVLLDGGEGGRLQPVTYAAQDPVSRALQAFSVDVGDSPDRATLLDRLRGASVTVTTDDPEPLTGLVLSVESQSVSLGDYRTVEQQTLNLLAEDGLHSVALDRVRRLRLNDAALDDELRQALAAVAQGRDANKRPVTITFSGQGRRPVQVGYLAEAPAWQTTYRLVLGESPLLQGWALVQNTGQDDWTDAHLALVSGRPISFIQDLYTPLYVHRPTVQARIPDTPVPQTYAGDLQPESDEAAYGAPPPPPMVMPSMMSMAAPSGGATPTPAPMAEPRARKAAAPLDPGQAARQSVASSGAQLGAALFAYDIDVPVSVPRQQSAMIPFVGTSLQAERVSIYNPRVQPGHPLSGARLRNTTGLHLMGGPLTVFDSPESGAGEARYVGDALIEDTEPGQTRLLTYALDLAVDAETQDKGADRHVTALTIAPGLLQVSLTHRAETVYTVKNNGTQPRLVLIEHPHRGVDWSLVEPKTPAERTADVSRFEQTVAPGASATFTVREERPSLERHSLLTLHPDTLHIYTTGPGSAAVRAALGEIIARRNRIAAFESRSNVLSTQINALSNDQGRIRQNMASLDHKSDLYRRYIGELTTQENQIAPLIRERQALTDQIAQAQADLQAFVSTLTLD